MFNKIYTLLFITLFCTALESSSDPKTVTVTTAKSINSIIISPLCTFFADGELPELSPRSLPVAGVVATDKIKRMRARQEIFNKFYMEYKVFLAGKPSTFGRLKFFLQTKTAEIISPIGDRNTKFNELMEFAIQCRHLQHPVYGDGANYKFGDFITEFLLHDLILKFEKSESRIKKELLAKAYYELSQVYAHVLQYNGYISMRALPCVSLNQGSIFGEEYGMAALPTRLTLEVLEIWQKKLLAHSIILNDKVIQAWGRYFENIFFPSRYIQNSSSLLWELTKSEIPYSKDICTLSPDTIRKKISEYKLCINSGDCYSPVAGIGSTPADAIAKWDLFLAGVPVVRVPESRAAASSPGIGLAGRTSVAYGSGASGGAGFSVLSGSSPGIGLAGRTSVAYGSGASGGAGFSVPSGSSPGIGLAGRTSVAAGAFGGAGFSVPAASSPANSSLRYSPQSPVVSAGPAGSSPANYSSRYSPESLSDEDIDNFKTPPVKLLPAGDHNFYTGRPKPTKEMLQKRLESEKQKKRRRAGGPATAGEGAAGGGAGEGAARGGSAGEGAARGGSAGEGAAGEDPHAPNKRARFRHETGTETATKGAGEE